MGPDGPGSVWAFGCWAIATPALTALATIMDVAAARSTPPHVKMMTLLNRWKSSSKVIEFSPGTCNLAAPLPQLNSFGFLRVTAVRQIFKAFRCFPEHPEKGKSQALVRPSAPPSPARQSPHG